MLKRLPSFSFIADSIATVSRRFPATVLSALVATAVAIVVTELDRPIDETIWGNIFLAAALGVPLGVALVVLGERRRWSAGRTLGVQLFGLLLLVGYYFTLPELVTPPRYVLYRFLLLALGLHFVVTFVAFVGGASMQRFWEFNKSLFLRYLLATLYAAVLYVGIALALAAIDHLFGADIDGDRYLQLWIILTGVVHPLIFLAGVPRLSNVSEDTPYPRGLKVFSQFILLPLVALYFVILLAYEVKIIATWNWPTGWVAELVLWYSVVGILSLLLLFPLREKSGNRWIAAFITWYFRVSIPLVVMLVLAIWLRIGDYGVTINRYLVAVMALGLVIVTGYFLVSRKRDIRIIPIVICALAFLSAYGPWSAFSVSLSSQQARFTTFMVKNEMWQDGRLTGAVDQAISYDDQREMSDILSYLADNHGPDAFTPWVSDSAIDHVRESSGRSLASAMAEELGFMYVATWDRGGIGNWFSFTATRYGTIPIAEYDYLIYLSQFGASLHRLPNPRAVDDADTVLAGRPYAARLDSSRAVIEVWHTADTAGVQAALEIPLDRLTQLIRAFPNQVQIDADSLIFEAGSPKLDARAVLETVSGRHRGDSLNIQSIGGFLLLREK